MKEAFEIQGLWYLRPDQPKKAQGILSYDPADGLILTLGADVQSGQGGFGDYNEADIILGESPNGGQITLHKCIAISKTFDGRTLTHTSVWRVNYAFMSIHRVDSKQLTFTRCITRISNLFEWLNQSGLAVKERPSTQMPISIQFDKPTPIEFNIDDKVIGRLQFYYEYTYSSSFSSTIDFVHGANLIIETKSVQGLHYSELLSYLKKFIYWLTISTGESCRVEKLTFFSQDFYHETSQSGKKQIPVEAYLRDTSNPFREPHNPSSFNFTYPNLGDRMPTLLTRWFSLYPDLSIVIQILAENIARNSSFSEFHFKDIVQALESYHRKRKRNTQMDKADYKAMVDEILGQIQNESHRKFVQERLNFGNEPTLAKRLTELIDEPNIRILERLIGDRESFVKAVKDNRNYLTHYDDSLKKKALSAADLYWLSEKALALLFVTLLLEVIPEKEFWEQWLQRSLRWADFIRLSEEI